MADVRSACWLCIRIPGKNDSYFFFRAVFRAAVFKKNDMRCTKITLSSVCKYEGTERWIALGW